MCKLCMQGAPVAVGGAVGGAFCIAAIATTPLSTHLLIMEPHYTGPDTPADICAGAGAGCFWVQLPAPPCRPCPPSAASVVAAASDVAADTAASGRTSSTNIRSSSSSSSPYFRAGSYFNLVLLGGSSSASTQRAGSCSSSSRGVTLVAASRASIGTVTANAVADPPDSSIGSIKVGSHSRDAATHSLRSSDNTGAFPYNP